MPNDDSRKVWNASHEKGNWRTLGAAVIPDGLASFDFRPGMNVLDVGCGDCGCLHQLRSQCGVNAYGVDISDAALRRNRDDHIHTYLAEATRLPFEGAFFDIVYSFGTIEHTDTQAALLESYRVLKPGGIALHSVPNLYSIWSLIRPAKKILGVWELGLEQSFSPRRLRRMFDIAGFREVTWRTDGFHQYGGSFRFLLGPLKRADNLIHSLCKGYGFFLFMQGVKEPSSCLSRSQSTVGKTGGECSRDSL